MLTVTEARLSLKCKGARLLVLVIAAAIAAYVSVTQQGFLYGVMNNVFHIPLVLRWAEDPVFANDQFVQSLKNFTSPLWMAVRLVVDEENIEWVFYLLHVLCRAAVLAALAWASASLGVRGLLPRVLLMFWFGVAPGLRWETPIGADEIFGFYFSHSEFALPLTIVAITLAVQRKYLLAFASLGLIANVNAFAAAWAGWALLGVAIGDKDILKAAARSAGGLAIAAALALPVAIWIFGVVHDHPVSGPEHERYLLEYYPVHFLVRANQPLRIVLFAAVALSSLIGFKLLAELGTAWLRAAIALCALIVLGMILPELVASRILLDLHLLRASGLVQVLAVLGLTVSAIAAMRSASTLERIGGLLALILLVLPALQGILLAAAVLLAAKGYGPRLVFGLSAPLIVVSFVTREFWFTPIMITMEVGATIAFLGFRHHIARLRLPSLNGAVAAAAGAAAGVAGYSYVAHNTTPPEWQAARDVASWARVSTPADAMFLVPETISSAFSVIIFESLAHRQTWVDWKRGGAVMWAPSYHEEWSRRMREVGSLPRLPARMAYACRNGIRYVLIGAETNLSDVVLPVDPVYKNDHFQVFDADAWCRQM